MGYGGRQAIRSGDIRRFNFTGNGSNTAFDLGFTPATQNQLIVTVNGLVQHYDAFSISGSTLTFTGTPASGDAIQVTAVVDAVGVAAIPDGAVANVSTLTVSGNSTFTGSITGTTTFANAVVLSSTANVAQGLTANTLTVSTNTATFGTAMYSVANGNIGIGTASPSSKLEIPDVSANGLRLSGSGDHALGFTGYSANAATQVFSIRNDGISNLYVNTQNSIPLNFGVSTGTSFGSTTSQMRIDSSGRITTPYQPAFYARGHSSTTTLNSNSSEVQIPVTYADTNIGSHYNTTNSRFTAPVAGMYFFSMQFMLQSWPSDYSYIFIRSLKNGSLTDFETMIPRGTSSYQSGGLAFCIYMNASDYMEVWARQSGGGSNAVVRDGFRTFTGHLIG